MSHVSPFRRGLTVGAAFALQALIGGCADSATGPNDATNAHMVVSAAVAGTPIATLVVEVTGPGITQALAFNITAVNGFASGTIRVPPGVNRNIRVRAFDTNGDITHEGNKLIELVRPGANPDVSIPMIPQPGQIAITVQIGNIAIALNQTNVTLGGGRVVLLTATVTAANGDVLSVPVNWATTNPSVASVATTGHVVGLWEGSAQVVATFAGVAAAANVTVEPCVITDYTFATSITGELTATDCWRPPNVINTLTGRAVDYYRATTTTQRMLQFDLTGGFDVWLWQFDANRNPLAWNDDANGTLQSQFRVIVAPGEYLIGASAFGAALGAYTLASIATSEDNANCLTGTNPGTFGSGHFFVTAGIITNQQLQATDCQSGTADMFSMVLRAGQTITVRMTSSAFNTQLIVGGVVNDDAPGLGTNSEVTYTAPTARQILIQARSSAPGMTGNYQLRVQ